MNTTNLFVELIVVGVGAFAWTLLILSGLAGKDINTVMAAANITWAIPLLSIVYVLGIVIDRIADGVFDKFWGNRMRAEVFPDKEEYYKARSMIFKSSDAISGLLEYGRSRLRICRGWSVNAVIMIFALQLYAILRPVPYQEQLILISAGTTILLIIAYGIWYAWRDILQKEYHKTRHQADHIDKTEA